MSNLQDIARRLRIHVVRMVHAAGAGHMGGPLGMADIYAALYFAVLNQRPQEPLWPERDRLILSCGHTCPIRYAAMAEAGYFPQEELLTLGKFGSRLQGHPSRVDMPALETSSGPLAQGISQALGMALEAKRQKATWHTYCIMSDGEHQEGQTWEAILLAGARKTDNLTVILDRNYIQIDGPTEEILPLDSLTSKYQAAHWHVIEVDGHNTESFIAACTEAKNHQGQPTCIIAHTVPGKGVSFMEHNYLWHGKAPNDEEMQRALAELEAHV